MSFGECLPQFIVATLMAGLYIIYASGWKDILETQLHRKLYYKRERVLNIGWKDVQVYRTGLAIWPWMQMTANSQKLFVLENKTINQSYETGCKIWVAL